VTTSTERRDESADSKDGNGEVGNEGRGRGDWVEEILNVLVSMVLALATESSTPTSKKRSRRKNRLQI